MLSIVTTGSRALRRTCLRMTRISPAPFPRGADVVLVLHLEHRRPDHPRVERGEEEREGEPWQNEVVGPEASGRRTGSRSAGHRRSRSSPPSGRCRTCTRGSTRGSARSRRDVQRHRSGRRPSAPCRGASAGVNAERIPIVKPMMSHISMPPSRSEPVTGSALRISSRTSTGWRRDSPKSAWRRWLEEVHVLLGQRPLEVELLLDVRRSEALGSCPAASGQDREDHERDQVTSR